MYTRYQKTLDHLNETGSQRKLPDVPPENHVNLASNDYLGLAAYHTWQKEFLEQLPSTMQFSASSSRLLTGNHIAYRHLENFIASIYFREACLTFNSGYHANIGILPALSNHKDLLLADKLVHASLIDGMQLSKARFIRFKHRDYDHLEQLLQRYRDQYEHVFIVTESLFSMDGDKADLQKLVELKKKYNAWLYVDEAHAVGVYGTQGLGIAEEQACLPDIDILVGTFGKALCSQGAYAVCDQVIKDFLVNKARSLIYSTALPAINVAWTLFIFNKVLAMQQQRHHLRNISGRLREALPKTASSSHIVPFIVGENHAAIALSEELTQSGFYALPIRHPSVPAGTARIRFSLTCQVQAHQIDMLIELLTAEKTSLSQATNKSIDHDH